MIKYLQVENFKSLKSVSVPFSRLNLYLGMNGMGKSSVIQSLLLMRQSYWADNRTAIHSLHLNGGLVHIGTQKDAFCQTMERPEMRFVLIDTEGKKYDLSYSYMQSGIGVDTLKADQPVAVNDQSPLFNENGFFYLNAEHISPRSEYTSSNYSDSGLNHMGDNGEYVVTFLARKGREIKVAPSLCHEGSDSDQLIDQVSTWLGTISPGVKIFTEDLPQEQKTRLSMRYKGSRLNTDDISPINTGFGVSYVLPLITELLLSGSDSLILLENPESHLHPRGQAEMARLISLAAANGAQIVCETHSDHIVNGVRVAVHDQILKGTDTYIGYFSKNEDQETVIDDVTVDDKGNLSDYPSGLLDEWGNQLSKLL